MTFTVSLSSSTSEAITVGYATQAAAARRRGSSSCPVSGMGGSWPGVSAETLTIAVIGDTVPEENERFR
jgi:hypothetical protein